MVLAHCQEMHNGIQAVELDRTCAHTNKRQLKYTKVIISGINGGAEQNAINSISNGSSYFQQTTTLDCDINTNTLNRSQDSVLPSLQTKDIAHSGHRADYWGHLKLWKNAIRRHPSTVCLFRNAVFTQRNR